MTAAKQTAVEEQAAHMTATMQRLQTAIATKDTLIAELQVQCLSPFSAPQGADSLTFAWAHVDGFASWIAAASIQHLP